MCYKCYDTIGPWELTKKGFICDECSKKINIKKGDINEYQKHKKKSR